MIFFTDITTGASQYCLLNIKQYENQLKSNKKLIFIDPSVYELKNLKEYSRINLLHNLVNNLKENEYISIDYPADMNITNTELFIQKSFENNMKYKDNDKYICTIQYKFHDFDSFKHEYNRLLPVFENNDKKIIGIGNMCRIMRPDPFTDRVFQFIADNLKNRRLHIYGLGFRLIVKYAKMLEKQNIQLSVDSTKFTRSVNSYVKYKYHYSCNKETRDIFFLHYIDELQKKAGIEITF